MSLSWDVKGNKVKGKGKEARGHQPCIGQHQTRKTLHPFGENSNGIGGFPDWCIILVRCNFAEKQEEELQELVRFFK